MPFNWKTPFGFLLAVLLQMAMNLISIAIYFPMTTYFAGSCWLFCSILDESPTLSVAGTSASAASTYSLVDGTSIAMARKLKKDFCTMVQFHSDAKELSGNSMQNWKRKKKTGNNNNNYTILCYFSIEID